MFISEICKMCGARECECHLGGLVEKAIKLIEGDRWYVQLGPRSTLVERRVVKIAPLTITLEDVGYWKNQSTYKRSDIEMVEKVT